MTRRAFVLLALATVVLAGCLGGPGTTTTAEPTDDSDTTDVSSDEVPGVTGGSLANATALADANEAALTADGGAVRVSRSGATGSATARLVVGADLATYRLTSSRPVDAGRTVDVDLWSNETTRVVRMAANGDVNYRLADRHDDQLTLLHGVEDYLAAGNFTVANESTGNGTVVFTADEFVPPADGHGPLTDVDSFSGRLVVDGAGLIHDLSVSATTGGETLTYRYELLRTGVDRAAKPDWFDDVPTSATLQPQLSVDVEDDSYLVVRNEGGDHVPRNATVSVTSNNTTATATLDAELEAGDTRYAYVDATTGELRLTADQPAAETVDPVTSPVSVSITTDDGVSLYSASMGWATETASASESGSSGGSSSASGGSASGGSSSSTGSSTQTTTTAP